MPDQTLLDFLAGSRMTQLAQSDAIKRGLPRPFADGFYKAGSSKPVGNQVEYFSVSGNRQLAQLVHQNSPSRAVQLAGTSRKYATALTSKENFSLDVMFLQALKSDIPMIQENAKRELVKRMTDFRSRFDNLRVSLVASAFALGAIYVDVNGNILPTSSGAGPVSVDFAVPTGNKITKNGAGSTYNIGDWANTATDIAGKLRALRKFNLKANNYQLDTILYGQDVPGFLSASANLSAYIARNPTVNEAIALKNEIPNGTLGFNWQPVYTSYFVDQNGVAQEWFPSNFIGALPVLSEEWYEPVEAGTLVPNGVASPEMTMDQMVELCSVVNGYYSYSVMDTDPLAAKVISGDGFLPLIKVPGTYYFGTCS